MRWLAIGGLGLLVSAVLGCGGGEPTGGDCTPRSEDFVDDRLVPAVQIEEASKSGELNCALICPPGTTVCQELAGGAGGSNATGGSSAGGMGGFGGLASGGSAAGGSSAAGGMSGVGGTTSAGGDTPSGDARLVRCSGTVSYPCG